MDVERPALVGLHGPKVPADAPKHRVLSRLHVVFEEHGHFPVEEDCRAEGIRYISRDRSMEGITLLSKVRERDCVGNRVPGNMVAAEERLE